MNRSKNYSVAVFAGDGIGEEITQPCLQLLHQAMNKCNAATLNFHEVPAGAAAYRDHGQALPDESMRVARSADAILLAAMGDPSIRYADGTEISPQLDLRFALELYAGIRPIRTIPGVPVPLADPRARSIDFVLIVTDDSVATETLQITRKTSEKLFHCAFDIAQQRRTTNKSSAPCRVTCVDKANVFTAFAFFRKVFNEVGQQYDIAHDHAYVDAMAMWLITKPWDYDVLVTENMFGDILSDQAAALIGGMGYAPSADIGDNHAVFQPCHGSAPDIAGKGIANPTAMFLSGAMMLEWLGQRRHDAATVQAAAMLRQAVDQAFSAGTLVTTELGGTAGVAEVSKAVSDALENIA